VCAQPAASSAPSITATTARGGIPRLVVRPRLPGNVRERFSSPDLTPGEGWHRHFA
jgi:hypothetical protein